VGRNLLALLDERKKFYDLVGNIHQNSKNAQNSNPAILFIGMHSVM
jgi:hypothetical protein